MSSKLRLAEQEDALLLLEWRNDAITRRSSHTTDIINKNDHIEWLNNVIKNKNRELYIYEENDTPVGTVRADILDDGTYELSWTVAPLKRGKGIAKKMLKILSEKINGTIVAEIKTGNTASCKVAKYIGMKLIEIKDGTEYYKRD